MLQCSSNSSTDTIDCVFNASIASAKVGVYSSSLIAPYQFTAGHLNALFDTAVALWFEELNAQEPLTAATKSLNSGFTTVALYVPWRFVEQLGTPFPIAAFGMALSAKFGGKLPVGNVFDAVVSDAIEYVLALIHDRCRRSTTRHMRRTRLCSCSSWSQQRRSAHRP